jgi:hypothetical protein
VATKAKAVEQALATREARHTMGKKQKQSIKGVVPSTAAPVATPAQVTQAPQPAQTAPAPQPVLNGASQ